MHADALGATALDRQPESASQAPVDNRTTVQPDWVLHLEAARMGIGLNILGLEWLDDRLEAAGV